MFYQLIQTYIHIFWYLEKKLTNSLYLIFSSFDEINNKHWTIINIFKCMEIVRRTALKQLNQV